MKILFLTLALFSITSHADEWRESDTYREAAYLTVHSLDWMQTRTIAKNPQKFGEENPILGNHPSLSKVNTYFAITAIAHAGVAYMLPSDWCEAFQYVTIAVETRTVLRNFSLGIKVSF